MKNSRIDYTIAGALFAFTLFITMAVLFRGIITNSIVSAYAPAEKEEYIPPAVTDLNRKTKLWAELLKYSFDPDAGALFESEAEQEDSEDISELGAGSILRKQYVYTQSSSCVRLAMGGFMRNDTDEDMNYLIEQSLKQPELEPVTSGEPLVLIMHTHTTECYHQGDKNSFDEQDPQRSLEPSETVVAVGEAIAQKLRESGIGVIHDDTVHDYPDYTGAYDRSSDRVKEYLDRYPTIQIVLDVHRDAIEADGIRYAPVATVNGRDAAQVMIIVGNMNVPRFRYNLRLASLLQSEMENSYPGITRPLLVAKRNYNQELTKGSILIEMGSSGNTLEEALYSGELVGISLAQLLDKLL